MSDYLHIPTRSEFSDRPAPSVYKTFRGIVSDAADEAHDTLFKPKQFEIDKAKDQMGDKIKDIARLRWLYETAKLKDLAAAKKYLNDNNAPLYAWRAVENGWNPDIATNDMVITDLGQGLVYAPRKSLKDDDWYVESTGDLITDLMSAYKTQGFNPSAVEAAVMQELGREGDYPSKAPTFGGTMASMVAPRIADIYGDDEKLTKRGGYKAAMGKAIVGDLGENAALAAAGPIAGKVIGTAARSPRAGKTINRIADKYANLTDRGSKLGRAATGAATGAGEALTSVAAADLASNAPGLESPSDYSLGDYMLAGGLGAIGGGIGRAIKKGSKREQVYDNLKPTQRKAMGLNSPRDIDKEALDVVDFKMEPHEYNSIPIREFSDEDVYFDTFLPDLPRHKNNQTKFGRNFDNPKQDQWVQYKATLADAGVDIPPEADEYMRKMIEKGYDPESFVSKVLLNKDFIGKSGDTRTRLSTFSNKKGYSADTPETKADELIASFGRTHLSPVNEKLRLPYKKAAADSEKRYSSKAGENYWAVGDKLDPNAKKTASEWAKDAARFVVGNGAYYGLPMWSRGLTRVNWQDFHLPDTED